MARGEEGMDGQGEMEDALYSASVSPLTLKRIRMRLYYRPLLTLAIVVAMSSVGVVLSVGSASWELIVLVVVVACTLAVVIVAGLMEGRGIVAVTSTPIKVYPDRIELFGKLELRDSDLVAIHFIQSEREFLFHISPSGGGSRLDHAIILHRDWVADHERFLDAVATLCKVSTMETLDFREIGIRKVKFYA